jgi:hypothetical protein
MKFPSNLSRWILASCNAFLILLGLLSGCAQSPANRTENSGRYLILTETSRDTNHIVRQIKKQDEFNQIWKRVASLPSSNQTDEMAQHLLKTAHRAARTNQTKSIPGVIYPDQLVLFSPEEKSFIGIAPLWQPGFVKISKNLKYRNGYYWVTLSDQDNWLYVKDADLWKLANESIAVFGSRDR